jgi:L-fucose isomerase
MYYRKPKIGILTISDNREKAHNLLYEVNKDFETRVVNRIRELDEIELVVGETIINKASQAVEVAKQLMASDVDGVIFNFSIWVYPNLAVIAAKHIDRPLLMLSNLNPTRAGLVGMMASAGSLDQLGIPNFRVWGDIHEDSVYQKILRFSKSAKVVNALKGSTYGMFGGRSMGMYTGVAEQSTWMNKFGIDCEHMDEMEIVRLAELIEDDRVEKAYKWLSESVGKINYDGIGLTNEKLKFQIRCYLATKDMVRDRELDFIGIKCQPEMGNYFVTQCLTQAFLNDPYDMEGEKPVTVCSCENDMDGALTMQILHLLTGMPTLFFDFRHYDRENDVFVFSNCGSQSTWYAGRSNDYKKNLKNVQLFAQAPEFFEAGGATVQYMATEGDLTCARLTRKNGNYRMTIFPAKVLELPREKMNETSPEWPQAFIKINTSPDELIKVYGSNHAHAVIGNCVEELLQICEMFDIETIVLD